jgi:hypothetical protein
MEKTGEIKPGRTPDTEGRLAARANQKVAGDMRRIRSQIGELDNDITKRLAQQAAKKR